MKKRELRLAVDFYGGVSLAVYIYGITRAIQKLCTASTVLPGLYASELENRSNH